MKIDSHNLGKDNNDLNCRIGKKVLLIFGTRPEAIKMAPLVNILLKNPYFQIKVCVTAQHREMLDQVLKIFDIKPDYDLNIMKHGQDLFDITSSIMLGMREILKDSQPDIVLVHGDTSTSTIAALSAFYLQIPIAHIEAGLRTNDLSSPWPEEGNRQITARLAKYHFAPTELAKQNLLLENILEENIFVTGNTVIDALYIVLEKINSDKHIQTKIINQIKQKGYPLSNTVETNTRTPKIILVTGHRRENHGQGFVNICNALKEIALKYPYDNIVYPVHLNPNVQKPVHDILDGIPNIYLIEPLEYLQFVFLMNKSYLVITDSGGIQEEAPGLGIPVIVMRDTTERPEAVTAGTVKLVGTDKNLIVSEVSKLIDNKEYYDKMSQANNPYGDGNACKRIMEILKK